MYTSTWSKYIYWLVRTTKQHMPVETDGDLAHVLPVDSDEEGNWLTALP